MPRNERPWSVPVRVEDVPATGLHLEIVADEHTREAIARIARLDALPRLTASFDLARRGDELKVVGSVSAVVAQTCVVTLEPVENVVEEPVDVTFAPPRASDRPEAAEILVESDAEDPPEALIAGRADLGALATEFLLLGIDPYPRKPGAAFASPATEEAPPGPFAALAALKTRPK
jgi:hypothetical protein